MALPTWLQRLLKKLEPPGNRAPIDESYRQPGGGTGGNAAPHGDSGGPDVRPS
jgi:hypothetical protein